jgi:hypothetical protein
MSPRLPHLARRLAAVAILLLLLAVAYWAVAQPVIDIFSAEQAALADQRLELQHYRELGRRVPQLTTELAELRRNQAAGGGFLRGESETLVAAQLHDRLKSLVEAEKGGLQSTQMLPAHDEGKFRRITLRAQLTLGMAGLQRVIYAIEANSPSLFVDSLDIKPHPGAGRPGSDPDTLDVSFDVYGYLSAGASSAK